MNKKLLLLVVFVCLISFPTAFSFYNSSAQGDGDVIVARFKPRLNGSVNLNQTFNLRETLSDSTYTSAYLVPGTSGVIELSVDFTNADISSDYNVSLGTYDLPENLKFYTDSNHTIPFTSFTGTYNINGNTTFNHNLYWYWEEKTDAASIANDALYENKDLEVPIIATMNKKVKASYE